MLKVLTKKNINLPVAVAVFMASLIPVFQLCLVLLGSVGAMSSFAQVEIENGQSEEKIVHLFEEPRHRTVLHEGQLYLLDMMMRPGDESFLHIHNQPLLLTYISLPADGPQNGRLRSATEYATEEYIHKISNPGPNMYRIIVLAHDGNGQPLENNDAPSGIGLDPVVEDDWFRGYTYELAPAESTPMQHHMNPSVIVLGTEGVAQVSREDGITRELVHAGEWAWRVAGSSYQITNVGDTALIVSVGEGRLQHENNKR